MPPIRSNQNVRRRKRPISVNQILFWVMMLVGGIVIAVAHLGFLSLQSMKLSHQPASPVSDALQSSTSEKLNKGRAPFEAISLTEAMSATVHEKQTEATTSSRSSSRSSSRRRKTEKTHGTIPPARKQPFPGSKSTVAYAISVTSCAANATTVFDGPAILSHSIHQVSIRSDKHVSKYDYALYAFVHPNASDCTTFLQRLGYTVLLRDIPFSIADIQSPSYRTAIEQNGCCGSKEFLKLWAYTLYEHDIVVHTDTDVFFLKPMDSIYDAMLANSSDTTNYSLPTMFQKPLPSKIEFLFTRDYLQRSQLTKNPARYGVQGGFFITRPDKEVFTQLIDTVLKGEYVTWNGWGKKRYGGYWGSAQIQGFLSYFYGEFRPKHAVELNRCMYNTMVDDNPIKEGKCRTGEESCEDCRETPLADMVSVHLTTCWKPWQCPLHQSPHPQRCADVHKAWFEYRKSLELSWGYKVPTDGWHFERTLGYCIKRKPIKKRFYVPLVLPNISSSQL